ncbi:adenylate/guanylate cyclase domain-containing protein [Mycolicibacterium sp. ND9-15]|uniref:AAA family ATPase n=1 Tax=Mycolicibacterium sp. ND9-15 TaxID=3042320 RepID=UPI002DD83645|nr:adenylate/guanylate cyclase domain-containing protein [Mycolicibacterium sp. ND9-15]WSE57087.1 adenylate/guanylate cyclase domain-containing protein [Mycolicibacterium sp. ND9-15]
MTTAAAGCTSCGAELTTTAKFCGECGAAVDQSRLGAEYKQVTVLFADVVHSMDIAAAVGAERLRDIMTELFNRSSAVVKRYGGTVDKFTGDGIMAVFGAPVALEDHALRACLAALNIQRAATDVAVDVDRKDGVSLQMRVGLNSGQVIAGKIGSGPLSYTAIGQQVGMAQRMESAATPGGVLVSDSTARLVEDGAVLGEAEMVSIKGSGAPVCARPLIDIATNQPRPVRRLMKLVGREWELSTISGLLDQSMAGAGRVVGIVGPPGVGKSRMVAEVASRAAERGAEVVTTHCESHAKDIPLHVASRLLRNVFGVDDLDAHAARCRIRARLQDSDPQDVVLLEDELGIRDTDVELPDIDPDARRRRVAALLNGLAVRRTSPSLLVIEDAHWIDEVSETMIAQLANVVPRTRTLAVITYRPEYSGALARLPNSHRIALDSLSESASTVLAIELMGSDPSVADLVRQVSERAAGNPFFAEEIVRDLAERGVIEGNPGAYVRRLDSADASVPASLHAAIAARIDRLSGPAKQTLNAAAVAGSRFDSATLETLVAHCEVTELVDAELIDQVTFTAPSEYSFRHPLIRSVAYESQLKSIRSQLHRSLADTIQARDPDAADANAGLIGEHLEAAGDFDGAYTWHTRAAMFADARDARAARASWQRACGVADRMPDNQPDRMAKRIAPRIQLCAGTWRVWGNADADFRELDALCTEAGDLVSKAIGMAGFVTGCVFEDRYRDAEIFGSELADLVESINDPGIDQLLIGAANGMMQGGRVVDALRVNQIAIDHGQEELSLANFGMTAVLAASVGIRALCRCSLGIDGWKADFDHAIAIARSAGDPTAYAAANMYEYVFAMHNGAVLPAADAEESTAAAVEFAGRASEDFAYEAACLSRGMVLIYGDGTRRAAGYDLVRRYRSDVASNNKSMNVRFADTEIAKEKAAAGDLDGAIASARSTIDYLQDSGDMCTRGPAVTTLVESLLRRGAQGDLAEAKAAMSRLAAIPTDPGFVLHELPLLRMHALVARAEGDEAAYRNFADRYRTMANRLGFEGHMATAATM